jgi:hypothetical protein
MNHDWKHQNPEFGNKKFSSGCRTWLLKIQLNICGACLPLTHFMAEPQADQGKEGREKDLPATWSHVLDLDKGPVRQNPPVEHDGGLAGERVGRLSRGATRGREERESRDQELEGLHTHRGTFKEPLDNHRGTIDSNDKFELWRIKRNDLSVPTLPMRNSESRNDDREMNCRRNDLLRTVSISMRILLFEGARRMGRSWSKHRIQGAKIKAGVS